MRAEELRRALQLYIKKQGLAASNALALSNYWGLKNIPPWHSWINGLQ